MKSKIWMLSLAFLLLGPVDPSKAGLEDGLSREREAIGGSVSFSDGPTSLLLNPAGLATISGLEALISYSLKGGGYGIDSGQAVLALPGWGISYWRNGVKEPLWSRYGVGWGLRIGSGLYAGLAYNKVESDEWKDFSSYDLGIMARPFGILSLGVVVRNINRPKSSPKEGGEEERIESHLEGGVAFRPFKGLILFADGVLKPDKEKISDLKPRFGLLAGPVKGISFGASRDGSGRLFLSIELGTPTISIGYSGIRGDNGNSNTCFLKFFEERRRSAIPIQKPKIAKIRLSGAISDEPPPSFLGLGGTKTSLITSTLEKLSRNDEIAGVLIEIEDIYAGIATIEEIRDALLRFRKSGKVAISYIVGEFSGTGEYMIASACDRIIGHPLGTIMPFGVYSTNFFLKGLLDKLGMKAEADAIGEYKSAAEPLTRESYSEPARKQVEEILDDIYHQIVEAMANGRRMEEKRVEELMNRGPMAMERAKELGLVDDVLYRDQIEDAIRGFLKKDVVLDGGAVRRRYERDKWDEPARIAVINATGSITTGESSFSPLTMEKTMGAETVARAIRRAYKDRDIKAMVIRVNSPGGWVLASERIWREVKRAREEGKPVVVSMSDVAASGGYYISCGADRIVALPGTITGSIGVVMAKLVLRGFYERMGINVETIKRGEHVDIYSSTRELTEEERKMVREDMEGIYRAFLERVSEGRKMPIEDVDRIGRGRIYTGSMAKRLGLVDDLGGMEKAVEMARDLAKIPKGKEHILVEISGKRLPIPELGAIFLSLLSSLNRF